MPEQATTDHRRAIAERNVAAILDAAERLLGRREQASITAVAAEAGLSRVTVYAHFATLGELHEAVVTRAVGHVGAVLAEADLASGSPLEALERMVTVAWRELDRNAAMAQVTAELLSPEVLHRTHQAVLGQIAKLVARGRKDGSFRTDLPATWLVTCCLTLMHACGDQVRAGKLKATEAEPVLKVTLRDIFVGGPEKD